MFVFKLDIFGELERIHERNEHTVERAEDYMSKHCKRDKTGKTRRLVKAYLLCLALSDLYEPLGMIAFAYALDKLRIELELLEEEQQQKGGQQE